MENYALIFIIYSKIYLKKEPYLNIGNFQIKKKGGGGLTELHISAHLRNAEV